MAKQYTFEEIKQSTDKDNIVLLIHNKVYAVSKFLDEHPGGDEVLLGEAGRDATEAFEDVGHSEEARDMMKDMLVGECQEGAPKGPSSAKKSAMSAKAQGTATSSSSGVSYLFPLAFLVAYLGYRK